ncbi:MAG TPA: hypothetical protein VKR21_06310 [Solirubrobacteraceae bacterium]|nr:hypothetical protein [Solirubrobacteraceae bacterium]
MSTFRRIDSLLEGKSSDQLAREVAARERERKAEPHEPHHQTPSHQPRHEAPNHPQERKPPHKKARPLLMRTSGSATEGIYGLVLALSVIAVSWYYGRPDAAWVGLSVLVTAVVFWLAHVYAYVLGRDMTQEQRLTPGEVGDTLRENWSLIEVVIPLVLVLGLGALGVIPDTTAIVAATVMAAVELASAGGYAAARHGASARGVVAAAAAGMGLGLLVVVLKAFAFTH